MKRGGEVKMKKKHADDFDASEEYKPLPETSTEDLLKSLHGSELDSIKEAIEDINTQIEERKALSTLVESKVDDIKTSVDNVINEFKGFISMGGTDSGEGTVVAAIIKLKESQANLDQFKVQEHLTLWKDIAALKKELRELVKEHQERSSRLDALDKIIE